MLTGVQVWYADELRNLCKTWYLSFARLKSESLCVISCYITPLLDHPSSFTSSLLFGCAHYVETLLSVYLLLLLLVPYLLSEISYICLQMKPSELPLSHHLCLFSCGDFFHNFTFSIDFKASYSFSFWFLFMLFPFTLWSFPVYSSYYFPFFPFPGAAYYRSGCLSFLPVNLMLFFLFTHNCFFPLKLMWAVQTQFVSPIHKRKSPQTKISPSCTNFPTSSLRFQSSVLFTESLDLRSYSFS